MKLFIVHYHYRPGGVRRVIEMAVPHLARELCADSIVLVGGEPADMAWQNTLRDAVAPTRIEFIVEPSFGYFSEQKKLARNVTAGLRRTLNRILPASTASNCIVWAHNLGLGRNLLLARELVSACSQRGAQLVLHHHDWWFENRWARWSELRNSGGRTLHDVAGAIFPTGRYVRHVVINGADAGIIGRHLDRSATLLPNPVSVPPSLSPAQIGKTRGWLRRQTGSDAPVWLMPCRLLRRKNIAEALLLTRWLRPEAWLVTTGGISSTDEQPYGQRLAQAALKNRWQLKLGALARNESHQPSVPQLLAASETVLLTSLMEGFGLPFVEAAAAKRPLVARSLLNVAIDLRRFGFTFPQSYGEIRIHPMMFDWTAEVQRQTRLFSLWKLNLPKLCRKYVGEPAVLKSHTRPRAVPFSRLTLTAQIEVLRQPVEKSWELCAPLNPFLVQWRHLAQRGQLDPSPWPTDAEKRLGGSAYAENFARLLPSRRTRLKSSSGNGAVTQREFIEKCLASRYLYPLLWSNES